MIHKRILLKFKSSSPDSFPFSSISLPRFRSKSAFQHVTNKRFSANLICIACNDYTHSYRTTSIKLFQFDSMSNSMLMEMCENCLRITAYPSHAYFERKSWNESCMSWIANKSNTSMNFIVHTSKCETIYAYIETEWICWACFRCCYVGLLFKEYFMVNLLKSS